MIDLSSNYLQVLDIVHDSIVDGPGLRTSIYLSGCSHRCEGCHNPQSWPVTAGKTTSCQELFDICLSDDFADVTFSGGDPMYQYANLLPLVKALREAGKNVWLWTGFTWERLQLHADMLELAKACNVIVDGPFVKSLHDDSLRFRGSSNQRILQMPAGLDISKQYDLNDVIV